MANKAVAGLGVTAVLTIAALHAGSTTISGHVFGFGKTNGCTLAPRPAEGDITPIHVECRWPVPAARVQGLLSDVEGQGHIFSNLAQSAVLEKGDDRLLVRQVYQAKGMADREVIVEWRVEPMPGGYRYQFRKAADQSALTGMHVEVAQSSGFWEVATDGDATRVVYELRYLPGGDLPPFLVHAFQASAVNGVLSELRDAAESQVAARRE